MLFNISNVEISILQDDMFDYKNVSVKVLRLDKVHPIVSGNKIFKLEYYLQEAMDSVAKTVITFGGAYSNHLVATAFACKRFGLKSIGIVRGEEPSIYSGTLLKCKEYGMKLHFISREEYREKPMFIEKLKSQFGDALIIPEGGYGKDGMQGAELIHDFIPQDTTHICCAIGTGTTVAGLMTGLSANQQLIGIPVLKGFTEAEEQIKNLCGYYKSEQVSLFHSYHFGGYAKKDTKLITFMNMLWDKYQLSTDFVYTAKMMFAVFDLLTKNYFPPQSNVLCIHTGGLQGNLSLPVETLKY